MGVEDNIIAPDVGAERRSTDRTRTTKTQLGIVRAHANQIGITMWVNLYSANKEDAFVPVLDVVKTVTGIAELLGPTYDPIVPA